MNQPSTSDSNSWSLVMAVAHGCKACAIAFFNLPMHGDFSVRSDRGSELRARGDGCLHTTTSRDANDVGVLAFPSQSLPAIFSRTVTMAVALAHQ